MKIFKEFEGKTAFVTGAASGMGQAAAICFGGLGCKVAVSARNPKALETVQTIRENGGEAIFVECDVTDDDSVRKAIETTVKTFGSLDYAFNNAVHDGFLDKKDPDLRICMDLFKELSFQEKIRLVNGVPVTKHSKITASQAFAMMAAMKEAEKPLKNIHAKLRNKGIWICKHTTKIIAFLNIILRYLLGFIFIKYAL